MKKTPIQIRFTDLDIFGHVNNAIYAELFDTARYAFIKELIPDMDPKGKSVVLVHLETNFRKQILFTDKVYVETGIVKVGDRSIGMFQRMVNGDGSVHADSYGVLSTYDAVRQESFPMPEEWRGKFESVKEAQ
ncbi:MAG: acyl-CoA thioesterase [Bacteroidales bacterium]|nr:acyl-CoA thioesterase [Bacteroidales bacterium]MDE7073368.1 acyl-CoA thioesterase [Bacteroidales bacterium]